MDSRDKVFKEITHKQDFKFIFAYIYALDPKKKK